MAGDRTLRTRPNARARRRVREASRAAVALAVTLLFAVVSGSPAAASTGIVWYGTTPGCWQSSGQAQACDAAPAGTLADAVSGDLNAARSGDFCNVYNASGACVDEGANWHLSLDTGAEPCPHSRPYACGVQHYVSLAEQSDLPWRSVWMQEPTLLLTSELELTAAAASGSSWAYLCPLLKAPGQPYYLEYCLDAWHGAGGAPPAGLTPGQLGLVASCAPVTVGGVPGALDTLVSPFALGQATPYATTLPGSANTQTGTSLPRTPFAAAITLAELRQAIALDNQPKRAVEPGTPGPGNGCERGLSTDAAEYRLVGVEQGFESAPGTRLAGTAASLELSTSYSPAASEALVPSLGA